jgi:acyl carrier protein
MPIPRLVSRMSTRGFSNLIPPNFAEEVVRHCLAEIGQPVARAARLEDLTLDSLTMVLVLITVEQSLGVKYPDEEVEQIHTLGEFAAVVQRHAEAQPVSSSMSLAKGA